MSYIDARRQFTLEVRAALDLRIADLVRALGIEGRAKAGKIFAKNPSRADRHAGSFVIWTGGTAAGAWKDYATGAAGDVFGLIELARGCTFPEAVDFAADFVGLKAMDPAQRAKRVQDWQREKTEAQEAEARALAESRKRAASAWHKAAPILGTPVEAYMRHRIGAGSDQITTYADAIRYEGITEYWPGRELAEDGTILKRGPRFPTMISPILGERHEIISVHRTFLKPDGRGKAPVSRQKLMFPRFDGARHYIPIANGPSGLSARAACEAGITDDICVDVEGIETGWAVALACPGFRVVAAGSNTELGNIPDFTCVSAYLVAKEPAKTRAADDGSERAIALLKSRTGKPVSILPAYVGSDLADTLNA